MKGLANCEKEFAKGAKKALRETARSAKTIAGREVTKVYATNQREVASRHRGYRSVDSVNLAGVGIDTYRIEWSGETYTPINFHMSVLKRGTVKWKPLKASGKVVLYPTFTAASAPFVARAKGGPELPWVRKKKSRFPVEVVHTHLAVPQMIDNEKVRPNIDRGIHDRLDELLNKYIPS